jgi:galactokinase
VLLRLRLFSMLRALVDMAQLGMVMQLSRRIVSNFYAASAPELNKFF